MFEEASEVFDNMFKSSFPLTFIVFIPAVLILVSPLPAEAAHEFTVYRMQQYDLQGQPYGKHLKIVFCAIIEWNCSPVVNYHDIRHSSFAK